MPDQNDPEYRAWLNGYRRKPSLKIRVEPFADREAHAAQLVARAMRSSGNYRLPMIPAVESAHTRRYCETCGEVPVWGPLSKEPKCPDCRLDELARVGMERNSVHN